MTKIEIEQKLLNRVTGFYSHSRLWMILVLYSIGVLVVTRNRHFDRVVLQKDTGARMLYAFLTISAMLNFVRSSPDGRK